MVLYHREKGFRGLNDVNKKLVKQWGLSKLDIGEQSQNEPALRFSNAKVQRETIRYTTIWDGRPF